MVWVCDLSAVFLWQKKVLSPVACTRERTYLGDKALASSGYKFLGLNHRASSRRAFASSHWLLRGTTKPDTPASLCQLQRKRLPRRMRMICLSQFLTFITCVAFPIFAAPPWHGSPDTSLFRSISRNASAAADPSRQHALESLPDISSSLHNQSDPLSVGAGEPKCFKPSPGETLPHTVLEDCTRIFWQMFLDPKTLKPQRFSLDNPRFAFTWGKRFGHCRFALVLHQGAEEGMVMPYELGVACAKIVSKCVTASADYLGGEMLFEDRKGWQLIVGGTPLS